MACASSGLDELGDEVLAVDFGDDLIYVYIYIIYIYI